LWGYRLIGVAAAFVGKMKKAGFDRTLEDMQVVPIMLAPSDLVGPFAGGVRSLREATAHPTRPTRRSERRPTAEVVKKLLFSGSVARSGRRVDRQRLLDSMVGERHNRFRNRPELPDKPASSLARESSLVDSKRVVLNL
jgi:hypothetical protein